MSADKGLGTEGIRQLAQQVLRDWQAGVSAEDEVLETCDCCGGLLGFEDPDEREVAEQWSAWTPEERTPSSNGVGDPGNGWPLDSRPWDSGLDAAPTGWTGVRDEDL